MSHHRSLSTDHRSSDAVPWVMFWMSSIVCGAWLAVFAGDYLASVDRPQPAASLAASSTADSSRSPSAPDRASVPLNPELTPPAAIPLLPLAGPADASVAPNGPDPTLALLPPPVPPLRPEPSLLRHNPAAITPQRQTQTPDPVVKGDVPGSVLLGGTLSLASIEEKAMVPAARIERTLQAQSADRLSVLPRHWRADMADLLGKPAAASPQTVRPAQVVRLPAPHRRTPEEIPLAVRHGGLAATTVEPSSRESRRALERWAGQQNVPEGEVQPTLVVLEPMDADPAAPPAPVSAYIKPEDHRLGVVDQTPATSIAAP